MDIKKVLEETTIELLRRASIQLPGDIIKALKRARREETSNIGRQQLGNILKNLQAAKEMSRPICQDTGLITFYVTIGNEFGDPGFLLESLTKATRKATHDIPLRPNAVHPLTRKNSGDNSGTGVPIVSYEIVQGDYVELTVLPKGAGAENMSTLTMLPPSAGIHGIKQFIINTVVTADGKPCPPIILGIGIGGKADLAMTLATRSLLRPLGTHHPQKEVAKLEEELLELVNATGIGPMGLGGKYTALGLNIEYAYCHPASLPVGITMQCWAHRRATARIYRDGQIEYI